MTAAAPPPRAPSFSTTAGPGGVAWLRFEQPGGRNLLDAATLAELAGHLDGLAANPPRSLVVASASPRIFAAGADLRQLASLTPAAAFAFAALGQRTLAALERLPCVTVAAISGACMGGGLDLAMACDLRVAGEGSRLAHPGTRLGIVTGFSGTWRWAKILAAPAARRLFVGGGELAAQAALEIGLVDAVVPDATVDSEAMRLATELQEQVGDRELRLWKEVAPRLGALPPAAARLVETRLRQLHEADARATDLATSF